MRLCVLVISNIKADSLADARLNRLYLSSQKGFAEEWPIIQGVLRNLKKPACLIAHNDVKFDFRILFHLAMQHRLLEAYPIPEGIYLLDTYPTFLDLEKEYHKCLGEFLAKIDWLRGKEGVGKLGTSTMRLIAVTSLAPHPCIPAPVSAQFSSTGKPADESHIDLNVEAIVIEEEQLESVERRYHLPPKAESFPKRTPHSRQTFPTISTTSTPMCEKATRGDEPDCARRTKTEKPDAD
jgi:hypothetical protein